MSTILITFKDPRLLSSEGKLFDAIDASAAENEPSSRHPVLESVPLCTIEDIHLRAETMSELLRGILENQPEPRWGINE